MRDCAEVITSRGSSRASFTQAQVSSSDRSFLTSFSLSIARKITSMSIFCAGMTIRCVIGGDHRILPKTSSGNHSSQVLIVVVRSSGPVLRMIAPRVRRHPSGPGFWAADMRKHSMTQPTDLPDPTGPRMPRTRAGLSMKSRRTSPSGV